MSVEVLNAEQVCALLHIKPRTLERRHQWVPKFPAPLSPRPLTWLRSEVESWIIKRNDQAQRRAA